MPRRTKGQHFLLTAAARSLSLAKVLRMTERAAEAVFAAIRWAETEGRTPLELASSFQVTKATMSHSIDVLTRRGFVRTRKHPDDGRSKLVFLTEAGRAFRDRAIEEANAALAGLMTELDREALSDMLPRLRTIREVLDRNR